MGLILDRLLSRLCIGELIFSHSLKDLCTLVTCRFVSLAQNSRLIHPLAYLMPSFACLTNLRLSDLQIELVTFPLANPVESLSTSSASTLA